MFDDLRQQADQSAFEATPEEHDAYTMQETPAPPRDRLLGMTPAQRFVIAVMLFLMTLIMSSLCLLVTEKVSLPF
jgi:hypothetical protein